MATLVFDIATVGTEWSTVSPMTQSYLSRWGGESEARERLGLSPLTGHVCALGVYDVERRQHSVYIVDATADAKTYRARSERELLEDFWEGARSYDVFVTFGGRRFDIPFLIHRSLACCVRPSILFPSARYLEKQTSPYHVDVHDQFTRYGDARFPVSLHLCCEAYGIPTPDSETVNGRTIGELFQQKQFADLAAYTERNVTTIAVLYERFMRELAPPQFLHTLMQ